MSSLHEATEGVAWTPELYGARSEHETALDNRESEFRAFVIGRYRWMHGSSMSSPMSRLKKRGVFTMHQFVEMPVPSEGDTVDILEIFGEDVRSLWLVIKKHGIGSGWNFDVTVSLDLMSKSDVRAFWSYLKNNKPKVIILAPWCPSRWGFVSRPEGRLQQRGRIVQFVADVAAFQTDTDNHFVAEQPSCSPMFLSHEWQSRVKNAALHECHFDQSMFGRKTNASKTAVHLVSSTELLVRRFRCEPSAAAGQCVFHYGSSEQTQMQVWPASFCDIMTEGVVDCLMTSHDCSEVYAAEKSKQCPGCKWHKRKDHPSHDRSENCKFRNVTPSKWSCPGCLRNKPRADPTHTLDDDCQWNTARVMPEGLGRERKGAHPRDVRVPAAAEPTASSGGGLRSVGSREAHPEDVPALRAQRAAASGSDPVVRRRDAETQVIEGGTGTAAAGASVASGDRARTTERDAGREAVVPASRASAAAPSAASGDDANAPPEDADRWTSFDLGRVLQDLRSVREGVVRRALRKLHIRWFHASAQRMKTLLTAAGVSPEIMVLVQQIVDTCDICRNWTRPGPRTVTSATVTTRFNEEIQVDLLFYRDKIVLHMIDRTTRFTVARRITSKHLDSVVEGIMSHWVGLFGPPNRITSDQEGALQSPEAAALLESRGIKLHLLAKQQHASIVERHHAILRRQLHVLEEQSTAEGLRLAFDAILGEAVYAKNALFAVGGASPFEAVFGRTPPLLGVVDAEIGDSPDDRDSDRIRQIAIQSMIQATAESKMKRANRGKSRMPGELLDLQVGDAVEFYRRATTKDAHSWFGPATVTDLTSVRDGQIGVKWQGRLMICRTQDVRRALLFWCFLAHVPVQSPVAFLCEAAEDLRGDVVRVGWFRAKDSWIACEGNSRFPRVLLAGLHVGSCALNLDGIVSFRFGSGVTSLPAVACDDAFLLWWMPGDVSYWYHAFMPGNQHVNMQKVTGMQGAAVPIQKL